MIIEVQDFEIDDKLKVLALQNDWGLREQLGQEGRRYVVDDVARARDTCLHFIDQVQSARANIVIIPELAIPRTTVAEIIQRIREQPGSVMFLGGIEGLTRADYETLLEDVDNANTQRLIPGAQNGYVNSMLAIVKSPTTFNVSIRAKRIASRPENLQLQSVLGDGPYTVFKLGRNGITIVPLICSEFFDEDMTTKLRDEVATDIHYLPVIQSHIENLGAGYTNTALQTIYRSNRSRAQDSRVIIVNQAHGDFSDGNCYVIVPPAE
jgi:hypothetical protein